jgi:hypothetical protein
VRGAVGSALRRRPGAGRAPLAVRLGLLGLLVACALAVIASPASAAYLHTEVTGEYGKEGPKASGIGNGCSIGFHSTTQRLYLLTEGSIYALQRTGKGAVSPIGGNFPIAFGQNTGCGDRDLAVDNTNGASGGNIYATPSNPGTIWGYSALGSALAEPWPVTPGSGESCGVAVGGNGNVWMGHYGGSALRQFTAAGSPTPSASTIPVGFNPCKIAVDSGTNDVFVPQYQGSPRQLFKFSAASEYAKALFVNDIGSTLNPGLAINAAKDRLYVTSSPTGAQEVVVYDTNTAAVLEKISTAPRTPRDVVVDEPSDTIYISVEGGGGNQPAILEMPGGLVPDVTTEGSEGNSKVFGKVELGGPAEVTECYFEFGTTTSYGSKEFCSPATPYATTKNVEANLPALTPEVTYHYRLVAKNSTGKNAGADKTITPHYVDSLDVDPADLITKTTARLNAHFIGNGEEDKVRFQWGTVQSGGFANQSAPAPGPSIGSPTGNTPISFEIPLSPGLVPETEYQFRVIVTNGQGATTSPTGKFKTLPAVPNLKTDPATNIGLESADLNASFTGDNLDVTYFFQYGSNQAYGRVTPTRGPIKPTGPFTLPAETIEGLAPHHTYHFRIVATNSFGTTFGEDRSFETIGPPSIVTTFTKNVTASTADLYTIINPHGENTTYRFEYGTTPEYGQSAPIPDGTIPASEADETRNVHLTDLNGGVYHFRVVATSVNGTAVSEDQTFNFYPEPCPNETVRQQTGADGLPDCRAYELVTPEDAGNTLVYSANVPFSSTAVAPSKLAWVGAFGLVPGIQGPSNVLGDLYTSTRTSTGWVSEYIGLPANVAYTTAGPPWRYKNPYAKQQPDKWHVDVETNQSMSRMVEWDTGYYPETYGETYEGEKSSNAPYVFETDLGHLVDRWPTNLDEVPGGEFFKGQTAMSDDLSHFVFTSDIPFIPGASAGDMYDNDTIDRTLEIINRDENDNPITAFPVELSSDGSHILMTVGGKRTGFRPTGGPGELFMRIDGETFDIAPGNAVEYIGMTPDGEKVFFTSAAKLAEGGADPDTSTDLYMWSESSPAANHLTLVSKGNDSGTGNTDACSTSWTTKCGVEAIYFTNNKGGGLGEEGGYSAAQAGTGGNPYSDSSIATETGEIYFLSPEQLDGADGVNGYENLYLFRDDKLQFVAALEPGALSYTEPQFGKVFSDNGVARLNISPDGDHMAFLSASKLTPYDNEGHSEMYTYKPGTEKLTCASCLPTGEPPTSDVTTSHNGLFMTDDGRTFFATSDPVVPHDTNKGEDVYEFVNGRPHLISSGTAAANQTFGLMSFGTRPGLLGVSADGIDVYFATYDVLVGQDRNGESIKIYDARTGGGFPFVAPPPGCAAADECHGPGSNPPAAATNGTGAHLGDAGNARPSQKAKKKKKGKGKKKKKRHASKKGGRRHG